MSDALPPIPAKRYFTIGEVAELCGVKQHVLRHWEQEFSQLRPMKRSGNRRYYQHHEVLMVRRIRELLHEQGYTIPGARNRLQEAALCDNPPASPPSESLPPPAPVPVPPVAAGPDWRLIRQELLEIRKILVAE